MPGCKYKFNQLNQFRDTSSSETNSRRDEEHIESLNNKNFHRYSIFSNVKPNERLDRWVFKSRVIDRPCTEEQASQYLGITAEQTTRRNN